MNNTGNIRQNFYQGQKVAPKHLNELQDYADKGANSLALDVLGYGIVQGFELSILEGFIVEVSGGSAFNQGGERLFMNEGTSVNLVELSPTTGEKTIKIGMKKVDIGSSPVLDSAGTTVNTVLTPSVEFITGLSLGVDVFELGEVILNSVGVLSVTKTAQELMTIPKQVQKTVALTCTEEQADLITKLINLVGDRTSIVGNKQLNIESVLTNIVGETTSVVGDRTSIVGNEQLSVDSPLITMEGNRADINSNAFNIDSDSLNISTSEFNLNVGNKDTTTGNINSNEFTLNASNDTLLKALSSLTMDSNLINLKTDNLQIDGVPYMEIGSNDNGHYVKFASGLLICRGGHGHTNNIGRIYLNQIFPVHISNTLAIIDFSIMGGEYTWQYPTIRTRFVRNLNSTGFTYALELTNSDQEYRPIWLAIGYWK